MSIFYTNIEEETISNEYYRKVLFISNNQQLVVMSLKPLDKIPAETHPLHDQFVRIEHGNGIAVIYDKEKYPLSE